MRAQLIRQCILLVFLLGTICIPETHGKHIRQATVGEGYLDYAHVTLEIGLPAKEYKLRVVFSEDELWRESSQWCPPSRVALYDRAHAYRSMSYEPLIEDCMGRDVVDLMGARWLSTAGFIERKTSRDTHYDGIIYLGSEAHTTPHPGFAGYVYTRTALDAVSEEMEEYLSDETHRPAGATPTCRITTHGDKLKDRCYALDTSSIGWFAAYNKSDGTLYTVCVSPDTSATFLPTSLYERYYHGKNIYHDDPSLWEDINLDIPEESCGVILRGKSMLPLKSLSIMQDTGGMGVGSMPTDRTFQHLASTQRGPAGGLGYNSLKVKRHFSDDSTIILGGNVLWDNFNVITNQRTGDVVIEGIAHRRFPTWLDILWLLELLYFYLRWKTSGKWFDRGVRQGRLIYMVVITKVSMVAAANILFFKLCTYLYYRVDLSHVFSLSSTLGISTFAFFGVALFVDIILTLMFLTSLRRRLLVSLSYQTTRFKRWFKIFLFSDGSDEQEVWRSKLPKKPAIPHTSRSKYAEEWRPLQSYARLPLNKPFLWIPSGLYTITSVFIEISFLSSILLIAATTDDQILTDVIATFSYSVVYFQVSYLFLAMATIYDWTSLITINTSPPGDTVGAVLSGAFTVFLMINGVEGIFIPVVDRYSSIYTGAVLRIVGYFYFLVISVLASLLAREAVSEIAPTLPPRFFQVDKNHDA